MIELLVEDIRWQLEELSGGGQRRTRLMQKTVELIEITS